MKKRCVEGSRRPTMPQSMTPIRPSRSSIMLPACTSPWKAPQRTVVRKKARMTSWTNGVGSIPEFGHPGQVVDGDPVEELHGQHVGARELRVGLGHGHQLQVELVLQPAEVSQRARLVAQVHLLADLHPEAVEELQGGAGHLVAGLAHQDLEQGLHEVEVGGHDVLDARPQDLDRHRAPVVAGGPGARPRSTPSRWGRARIRRRRRASGSPRSSSTRWRTSGNGTGGPVSRQARNSSATSSPNMPGEEAMIWPNFMKVPPRSWKLLRRGRASCAGGNTPWRMCSTWRAAVGVKWKATTLAMVRLRRSSSRRVGSGRCRG